MGISGISSNYNNYNTANYYRQLSSGRRINSASDDASGLAIANRMKSQESGLDVGASNAQAGNNVTKVADGALSGIGDSLQRIHELSLKASNGILSQSDKGAIQSEINGLLDNIRDIAGNTEFNTMKLLDGSMNTMDIATNPDGTGIGLQMQDATLQSLGIAGYDVTGSFDINRITSALDKVNEARSSLGASSNALEMTYNGNRNTSINTTASRSAIEDLEYMSAMSNFQKNKILESFQTRLQAQRQQDETTKNQQLFNMV